MASKLGFPGIVIVFAGLILLSACSQLQAMAPPTVSPLAVQGKSTFEANCRRCHETTGDIVVVGPSLNGVATRAKTRIAGLDAAGYIRNSIEQPGAYVVDGFADGLMPRDFKEQLTPEQIDGLVAFLLTLE